MAGSSGYYRFVPKGPEAVKTGYHENYRKGPGNITAIGYETSGGANTGRPNGTGRLRALSKARRMSMFALGEKRRGKEKDLPG